jgi:hypothetical protein
MKRIMNIVVVSFLLTCCYCSAMNNDGGLIILSNEKIEVGIMPEIGGRIVLLRRFGFQNILKSDSSLWCNPGKHKPEISAFSDFVAFNGHITWVGPQSEWWTHQTLNEARKKAKADWPPDPYLTYGTYEIIGRSDTSIRMVGPESPISGVRFFKEISINNTGVVTITSTAENIRNENVSWDLWMLTRLDGFARVYVPVEESGILELVKTDNETTETTRYNIIDKYFTFYPSVPAKPKIEQVQEVHLYPLAGFIAGFNERQMLLIRFDKLSQNLIHPKHGLVELYNYINDKSDDTLLELEVHSAYKTLAPRETMSLTETWELMPYVGNGDSSDQIIFLNNYLLDR